MPRHTPARIAYPTIPPVAEEDRPTLARWIALSFLPVAVLLRALYWSVGLHVLRADPDWENLALFLRAGHYLLPSLGMLWLGAHAAALASEPSRTWRWILFLHGSLLSLFSIANALRA